MDMVSVNKVQQQGRGRKMIKVAIGRPCNVTWKKGTEGAREARKRSLKFRNRATFERLPLLEFLVNSFRYWPYRAKTMAVTNPRKINFWKQSVPTVTADQMCSWVVWKLLYKLVLNHKVIFDWVHDLKLTSNIQKYQSYRTYSSKFFSRTPCRCL